MVTFVEESPSGKRDTRIIVVKTEDLQRNNMCTDTASAAEGHLRPV
jgi:hypothetical protein